MFRGRSKDPSPTRKVSPGSAYMSNDQFANYLADLRNNRVARPSGARPQPPSASPTRRVVSPSRQETTRSITPAPQDSAIEVGDEPPRSKSALAHSHRRKPSSSDVSVASRFGRSLVQHPSASLSNRDFSKDTPLKPSMVVPSATYIERGSRWMEKEEVVSLRDAMADMDLKKQEEEEARLFAAAQKEASELVAQHLGLEPMRPNHNYTDHLKKNSYQQARVASIGATPVELTTGLARDFTERTVSGSSESSSGRSSSRISSRPSRASVLGEEHKARKSEESHRAPLANQILKTYPGPMPGRNRRHSSGNYGKRNISGERAAPFTGDQIYEEPDEAKSDETKPDETKPASKTTKEKTTEETSPLRPKHKNPLNRVQFAQQDCPPRSSSIMGPRKEISRTEIYRNPPSQSRNPLYTTNEGSPIQTPERSPERSNTEPIVYKDGKEVRSDEIRKATSMLLKDRSPKLPTPTAVSSKLGRPIVSFDANWKPKDSDEKPEDEKPADLKRPQIGSIYKTEGPFDARSAPPTHASAAPKGPHSVPAINFQAPPVPAIQFPDAPSIQIDEAPNVNNQTHRPRSPPSSFSFPIPTINVPEISVSDPSTMSTQKENGGPRPQASTRPLPNPRPQASTRPLPDPKTASSRPRPQHISSAPPGPIPRGHWSRAGARATAACHQCGLPIEGRSLNVRGVAERFHPYCLICSICGTNLEALELREEPSELRAARLARIQRRLAGEILEENPGETMADDGDERLRFYCHLDWHELYAERCKHCKTPIIGKHIVAMGNHYHEGHFFCGECGDPFENGKPHIEKNGFALCLECGTKHTANRAPKCRKCRKPVIGQYVVALGGEWHDECFRCAECAGGFEDGQIYPEERGKETLVFCLPCMERKWKA